MSAWSRNPEVEEKASTQVQELPQEGTAAAAQGSVSSADDKHNYHVSDVDERVVDLEAAKWARRENGEDNDEADAHNRLFSRFSAMLHSPYAIYVRDFGLIALILGWWIPSIINPAVRYRWVPATILAWFFILLILFHHSKYIPQKPFKRVLVAVWMTCLGKPWSMLPYRGKLAAGWFSLAVLIFGTTYGLPKTPSSTYTSRTISLVGLVIIYGFLFALSHNHKAVKARTTVLGIGFQFIIALFVFRTDAGFSLFNWIAQAADDLLTQAQVGGAAFFWSPAFIENHYFFVNTLASIIFFVALCIALFYTGALTWVIKKAAWFFHVTFGISGAEAVVAVASPFIGQGENCVLVRPYARLFTRSEFHQVLTSGFAAIAGSVLVAYIQLGVPGKDLVTSSVMSIPASIAASKMIYPETQESETQGKVTVERKEAPEEQANDLLHALSNGAWFGVRVAAAIFCNVLVLLSTVYTINGLLTYIGKSWYITENNGGPLTLQVIFGHVLYPLTFMLGVPGQDTLKVAKLIATKIVANEFVAYSNLHDAMKADPNFLSPRAFKIASYALCGFGNISSVGINIGVLSAIAPKRAADIVKLAPSALLTGILVTLSSAAIAGIVSAD